MIFDGLKSGEMLDFSMFCRSGYRTRKWVFRHGNNRYALFGNRTFVLKCKPTGDAYRTNVLKYTIIVQYYSIFLVDPLSGLLHLIHCNSSSLTYYKVKTLNTFRCSTSMLCKCSLAFSYTQLTTVNIN